MKITKPKIYAVALVLIVFSVVFFSYYRFPINGIKIRSDSDFKKYMCPGKGTETNPYRIENRKIKVSRFHTAIAIFDTTKHFIIENCFLEGGDSGIHLRDIAEGTGKIVNCTITNTKWTKGAIYLSNADGTEIFNNTISSNEFVGRFEESDYLVFSNNYMINNRGGLVLGGTFSTSHNFTLKDNIFENSPYIGLFFVAVSEVLMKNNYFYNSSIGFDTNIIQQTNYHETFLIEECFVNDKQIGVFRMKENLTLTDSYGQLLLFDCTNLTFINQNFNNVYRAIYADNCINITITDSVVDSSFSDADRLGLYFYRCSYLTFNNVTFIEGKHGFYFSSDGYLEVLSCYFYNQTVSCISIASPIGGKIVNSYFISRSTVQAIEGDSSHLLIANNTIIKY